MQSTTPLRFWGVHVVQWMALSVVIGLGVVPLGMAFTRLWAVTGITPWGALSLFHQQPGAVEALRFSLLEATFSTLLTVVIGLPLAWAFSRYD